MNDHRQLIEDAFEQRAEITPTTVSPEIKNAILEAIDLLDAGAARVAEKIDGKWVVNQWLKKAVLLYFRIEDNVLIPGTFSNFYDKVPTKFSTYDAQRFDAANCRV
ncbi:MAG: 2,3,4,5-tetrahydropyridine-2,6-dicarboxylate N-succinyltransferase, partial [Gammaproteobacteria bacterium]|nr:2,3,4,5-tetrahydropyridine-2,6-dicarboxylate N-succinyltransferase [Gammaproteobacteria bacterium]